MMDFRRRKLILLGSLAAASVALAALALTMRAQESQARFTSGEFLPGFAAHVKEATQIHIVAHDGAFDVTYDPAKGWLLPARGNYPADFEQVRHTLIGMAALQAVEPKTARADWLSYLGLDTPPKGNGTAITVSDKAGKTLASVIVGNIADLDDAQGGTGVFVRRPGDNQSYLARTVFAFDGKLADWLEAGVMNIEPARVNSVTITLPTGGAFTVLREHTSARQYTLQGAAPPKGFSINPALVNLVPQLISGFTFADVQPASRFDFSKAVHLTSHTFDMQNIRMDAVQAEGGVWVRLSAQADPGTPTMQRQEASMLNTKAANWAYKLSPDKARLLMLKREDLFTKAEPQGMPFGAPN